MMYKRTAEDKKAIEYWLGNSKKRFEVSELLMEMGSAEGVVDRSFFGAFDTARALLLTKGMDSKKHEVVLSRFVENFVETGKVPKKMADTLAYLIELIDRVDFEEYYEIDMEKATKIMDDAKEFASIATETVNRILEDNE